MMKWFNILKARLRALFQRESVFRDIDEELRIHIAWWVRLCVRF
jgi:hypothetical protein